jgi:enoyl-CoA hydratase/carnithine racemase
MATALQVPPHTDQLKVSFPTEHVLMITFNRPKSLNAMTPQMTADLAKLFSWFEAEPALWQVFSSSPYIRGFDSFRAPWKSTGL